MRCSWPRASTQKALPGDRRADRAGHQHPPRLSHPRRVQIGLLRLEGPPRSASHAQRIWLAGEIAEVHKDSGGTYGSNRLTAELKYGRGIQVGHNAVELIMRELGT